MNLFIEFVTHFFKIQLESGLNYDKFLYFLYFGMLIIAKYGAAI